MTAAAIRRQQSLLAGIPSARRVPSPSLRWGCLPFLLAALGPAARAQIALPDAPAPRPSLIAAASSRPASMPFPDPAPQQTFPPETPRRAGRLLPGLQPTYVPLPRPCSAQSCSQLGPARSCCEPGDYDDFGSYLSQNAVQIYTPAKLAALAWRGVIDPFNLLTIGGTSVISVATDSHSPYGPGFHGWARLSGVALTQDMTGEFVGTFMIPSIDHQDPHFHREPNVSVVRRTWHCLYQPFWTVSDRGRPMPNYSTLVGSLIDEAVDVSYVPYQQTGWGASAERIASAWATDPIGNFVTEFVPDVARHVNINVVFIQRIVNRVALEEGSGPGSL
ncbi:MAG TPA: hypothetical protein VHX13_06580 [Acidobacteriaceae bacterium]|jgi:hypothetical protein|nr:hypothetical protein [Acidobacteriaceae bacterium]